MNKSSAGCTYSADVNDWIRWGGDPTMWCLVLHELSIDGHIWRCPHASVAEDTEGNAKCVFHLAPENIPEGENVTLALSNVLTASDNASDAWSRRLKQFIGATFDGLMLDDTVLAGEDDQPLYLIGATVTDGLTVSGPIRQQIIAALATFQGQTDCRDAMFEQETDFRKATFKHKVDFREATFKHEANFREATFADVVDFARTTFEHRVNFRKSTFQDRVNFDNATFDRRVVFSDATFKHSPDFQQTKFQERCQCCTKDPTSVVRH